MPQRRCVGCGRVAPKRTLLRYVVVEAAVVVDPEAQRPGRGAYTCATEACVGQARARGGFNRAFRQSVRAPRLDHENVHLRHE